jgi:hypothetical protein
VIDFVTRLPHKSASLGYLRIHIAYLSDGEHEDHKGKIVIHPPKFFHVEETVEAFLKSVVDGNDAYLEYRKGRKGKRTDRLWDEAIYRPPDDTELDEEERAMIELVMLSIKPETPTLLQWHKNTERNSWDLHVLTPAKSTNWPPCVHLSAEFGGGKKHIYAALERLDQELVDLLNERRPPDKRIVSARERRKKKAKKAIGKPPKLAREIAKKAPKGVTAKDLTGIIAALGHTVTRISERFVSVIFKGRVRPRRHAIDTLLQDVEDIRRGPDDPSPDGPSHP